jgi:glycerol-3-phosphate acyltransferase PlsY
VLRLIAGCAAVMGHVWTVFAGFRGGKGVATAAGVLLVLAPWSVAISALVFGAVILITGIVSLGSLSAAVTFPLAVLGLGLVGIPASTLLLGLSFALAVFVIFTHRSNMRRLMAGEENRFEGLRIFHRLLGRKR